MLQQYTISRDSQCWVHRHKLICSKDAEETCHCVHSKNWHTCHKLDNLLLVQTLELSNNLQEPLCLPPLSSSPTIAFHTVYQYLDLPTPHSTVAQQEFHSCGVSQGSCSAERAIPNLQKFVQWVKSVLLVQSSGVSTGRIQKLCPKQANYRMNPVSTHYGNHSSTNCWLCLGNQSANTIQCIRWLKRNALIPGETFVINITHKLI